MIEGYVGLIGGGKSYNATDRILRYMAAGGVVYTNMTLIRCPWYNQRYASKIREFRLDYVPGGSYWSLNPDQRFIYDENGLCLCRLDKNGFAWANSCGFEGYLRRVYKWQYQEGQYNKLCNEDLTGELHSLIPKGTPDKPVLCVLDEAVDFFDTDDRTTANREFLSFLRHSRKQSVDMIFIAQDFTELNKRIRNQTHFIWTFWDMQTFKIPGLRSTLPPPWKNMILCQQWNRNMSGGVLKRIWKTRDAGIFGCYRTDELFRSLKSADGKTDFSGEGNIKEVRKKMNMIERVALFACVFFSVLGFLGKGNPPAADASVSSGNQEPSKPKKEDFVEVVSAPISTVQSGDGLKIFLAGEEMHLGWEYSIGQCVSVGPRKIEFIGHDSHRIKVVHAPPSSIQTQAEGKDSRSSGAEGQRRPES